MFLNTLAVASLGVLSVAGIAQHAWYWNQLPDRVATHFGFDGQPNDWMSKTAATLLLVVLQVGLPWIFMLLAMFLDRLPNWSINMPNRDYWLQPERRAWSLAKMSQMLCWVGVMTSLEIMVMSHLTFQANQTQTGLNTPVFFVALVIYLAVVLTMAFRSSMQFYRVPA